MAVVNPPAFLQSAGSVHTAEVTRALANMSMVGAASVGSLRPRGGIHTSIGSQLKVQQAGTPNMSVDVLSGMIAVPGTESGKQGCYHFINDATVNVTIAAADATNPRIDLIVARIQDSFYSGASNTATIERVAGTPAASPSAPATPANSLILAQIAVGAAVTSIVNGNITDKRIYAAGIGGRILCTSTTRPATTTVPDGQSIYETDTELVYIWNATTAAWRQEYPYRKITTLGSTTASVTFSNIPATLKHITVSWRARCTDAGFVAREIRMRINGNTGLNYFTVLNQAAGATNTVSSTGAVDSWYIGLMPGSTATANRYGDGEVRIKGWHAPSSGCLTMNYESTMYDTGTTNAWQHNGGGVFDPAGPYTSITLLPTVGSFVTGSYFEIIGWD